MWHFNFNIGALYSCIGADVRALYSYTLLLYIPYSLEKFVILIFVREKIFVHVYSNPDEFPVSLISAI